MQTLLLILLAHLPIQIDGSFSDWNEGLTRQEDAHYVYALVELPEEACLQQLEEQKVVELGEYTVIFSPKNKGYGVSCKKGKQWISPYEAGVVFAPTTSSTKFELRVNKPSSAPKLPFSLTPKSDVRVVSWNVQFGQILDDLERSSRLLNAMKPDVLLLQELDGNDTPKQLNSLLQKALGGTWYTEMSIVHGTERHHQLRSSVSIKQEASFVNDMGQFKALYGTSTFHGKPIHFFSLHLRCCGGPTGEAENQRQNEAKKIHTVVKKSATQRWIIAGDLNLVGTTKPLEIVQGDTLAIVEAFQPDGRLNATWSDTTSSFTPGRLDWMLYSPETLELVNSFVLDTGDLDITTLHDRNLRAEDTALLSDHLPLIADFKVIK